MFGLLRGKADKGPPVGEVLNFELGSLELRFPKPVAEGAHDVLLRLPAAEGKPEQAPFPAKVTIESFLQTKNLHWATLDGPPEALEMLRSAYPEAVEELEAAASELVWEEKRSEPRLQRAMGIMSPNVNGFKALTWDVTVSGLRISVGQEFPVGQQLKLRLDLDDHRLAAIDLHGEVLWTKPVLGKGFWSGVRLIGVPPNVQAIMKKFIDEALSHEGGVLDRNYAAD